MPARYSAGQAAFGAAFTALLAAAGLTVDGVLRSLPEERRGRVSRSTLYDWRKGEHLPLDASGALMEVVQVCLDATRQRGAGLGVSPVSEDGWRRLLAEARQARDAEMALARYARGGERCPAWRASPVDGQDPASLSVHQGIRPGRPPGWGVFVGRADELAVLEAAGAEARGGHPKVVLVEGEAGIGKSTLLAQFAAGLADTAVLRASGDEAERLVPYGIVGQLAASARGAGGRPPGLLASELNGAVDPLAVGAELVLWLGQVGRSQKMVLACVDDLQWADEQSVRALLFAIRRLQADPVLVAVSARIGELAGLGEGWPRFVAGDHRAGRIVLGGLRPGDVAALGRALGTGELPRRAVARLLQYTGGNPLHIRAVLEESGAEGLDRPGGTVGVPRSLAAMVLARVGALSPAARQLVAAAAVLGHHCPLAVAAALAGLDDPLPALEEAAAAGVLTERPGAAAGIGFSHLLMHRAVYDDLSPTWRRRLHARAAGLVDRGQALAHRVAASMGPDDGLAGELEAAGREARELGRIVQAADWLAQAAAASGDPAADRRLLDALEILVTYGEVARAEELTARVASATASPRCCWLLGTLDFLAGRTAAAEARLVQAWQAHDPARNASVGAAAATQLTAFCMMQGRAAEAVRWGERAARADAAPADVRHQAQGMLAVARVVAGQGPQGLAGLAFLPAAPSEVPREDTDTLVYRGLARNWTEDFAGAVADLTAAAARLRAGVPLRDAGLCLGYLAGAEYRLGSWDDAVVHAELAVSLAHDADRVRDLGLGHSIAALVPAARGDWELADAHVRMATEAAQAIGVPVAIIAAATARAFLAAAQGNLEGVTDAAAAVRATGIAEYGLISPADWRCLEIAALIGQHRLGQAETALTELEAALAPAGPPSALAVAARLRGDLASAAGRQAAAAEAIETAWRHVQGLRVPLTLAQLEISDARQLRAAGQPQAAVARLRSARQRLTILGARPYLQACDQELAAAAAPVEPETIPAFVGLTAAEQAVARLVVVGHSNRQAAAELYVSVKTVESHLGHIFAKLGIRSRHDLITRIGAP